MDFLLCSECFQDQGLKLDSEQIGIETETACPNCGSKAGRKLSTQDIGALAHRFFVWGSLIRFDYGAAPQIQFNKYQSTSIDVLPWLEADVRLIEKALGVGFFHYGPRLWMLGEVEPLKGLQQKEDRASIIERIVSDYPALCIGPDQVFYRVRVSPEVPGNFSEYDSPPIALGGVGRLDSTNFPVMYGSQDLEVCIHECRITADDTVYVATLAPTRELKLLDLTELVFEEHISEFESLDMAVHMLFLAGEHSYDIARQIALAAREAGYDGLVYPSYFSLLRTGAMPFETVYGISHRRIQRLADREKSKIIPNLALFGHPIERNDVEVRCINKLILNRVEYDFHFGPVVIGAEL